MTDARIVATRALAGVVLFGPALLRTIEAVVKGSTAFRAIPPEFPEEVRKTRVAGYSLATRTRLRPACLAAYRARSACSPIW